ncbi:MAG: IS200/IS605 family transposase [Nanoarchaeota archaeon]
MLRLKMYSHSVGQNAFHVVFRTKYNLKFFHHDICRDALVAYLEEAALRYQVGVYAMQVMPDHVHLFLEMPPTMSPARLAQLFKGYTSRRFFLRFDGWRRSVAAGHDGPHLWSRWRFSRSVGNVNAGVIDNYIRNSSHNQFAVCRETQTMLVRERG